jgi:hypothetical protein
MTATTHTPTTTDILAPVATGEQGKVVIAVPVGEEPFLHTDGYPSCTDIPTLATSKSRRAANVSRSKEIAVAVCCGRECMSRPW